MASIHGIQNNLTEARRQIEDIIKPGLAIEVTRASGEELAIRNVIGPLSNLNTGDKSSIVAAINSEAARAQYSENHLTAIKFEKSQPLWIGKWLMVDDTGNVAPIEAPNVAHFLGPYDTVDDLPSPLDFNDLYLVVGYNGYDIYANVSDVPTKIGETDPDLTNYYKIPETDALVSGAVDIETTRATTVEDAISGDLSDEIDRAIASEDTKVDKDVAGLGNKIVQDVVINPSTKTFVKTLLSLEDGTKEIFSGVIPIVYEAELESGLLVEEQRARNIESGILEDLDAEIDRAIAAEDTKVDKNVAGKNNKMVQDITINPATKTFVKKLLSLEDGSRETFSGVIPIVLESELAVVESGLTAEINRATTRENDLEDLITTADARARTAEDTKVDKNVAGTGNKIVQDLTIDPATKTFVKKLLSLEDGSRETFSGMIPVVYESELAVVESGLTAEISRAQIAENTKVDKNVAGTGNKIVQDVVINPETKTFVKTLLSLENGTKDIYSGVIPVVYESELLAEQTRAMAVESGLASGIASLSGVEFNIASDLADEIARAKGVESGLLYSVNNEIIRSTAEDHILASGLSAEITRSYDSDTRLTSGLNDEITRATAAESGLAAEIDKLLPVSRIRKAGGTGPRKILTEIIPSIVNPGVLALTMYASDAETGSNIDTDQLLIHVGSGLTISLQSDGIHLDTV
jgi:hypothetical protein